MNPHYEPRAELLKALQTSQEKGLSSDQAAQRLAQYGENKLNEKKKKPIFSDFWSNSRML